jgi:hypothetical protein
MDYNTKLTRDISKLPKETVYDFNVYRRQILGVPGVTRRISHSAFEEVVKMGSSIYPLIIERLVEDSTVWSWALSRITNNYPLMDQDWTSQDLVKYWTDWYLLQ